MAADRKVCNTGSGVTQTKWNLYNPDSSSVGGDESDVLFSSRRCQGPAWNA